MRGWQEKKKKINKNQKVRTMLSYRSTNELEEQCLCRYLDHMDGEVCEGCKELEDRKEEDELDQVGKAIDYIECGNDRLFYDEAMWMRFFEDYKGGSVVRGIRKWMAPPIYLSDPESFFVRFEWLKGVHMDWQVKQACSEKGGGY